MVIQQSGVILDKFVFLKFSLYVCCDMKQIANILTKNKFSGSTLYNVTATKGGLIEGLPTLVIGNSLTKDYFPNYSIIDAKVNDDTFWTYGPREKRDRYEENLVKFNRYAVDNAIKNVKYVFVPIITLTKKRFDDLITFIETISGKTFIYNNMCYVYKDGSDDVLGISLSDLEYIGYDIKVFLSKIYNNTSLINISSKDIPLEIRDLFQGNMYVIPYIM